MHRERGPPGWISALLRGVTVIEAAVHPVILALPDSLLLGLLEGCACVA